MKVDTLSKDSQELLKELIKTDALRNNCETKYKGLTGLHEAMREVDRGITS